MQSPIAVISVIDHVRDLEKKRAAGRRHYWKYREKKLEYHRRWRIENHDYKRQKDKEYYEKNKVHLIPQQVAYTREWRKRNPERYKAQYKHEIYNRCKDKILEDRKKRILFIDKRIKLDRNPRTGVCQSCGKQGARTEIHHIKYHPNDPLKDTVELCTPCHRKTFPAKGKGRLKILSNRDKALSETLFSGRG